MNRKEADKVKGLEARIAVLEQDLRILRREVARLESLLGAPPAPPPSLEVDEESF